jgi:hypothetical protein
MVLLAFQVLLLIIFMWRLVKVKMWEKNIFGLWWKDLNLKLLFLIEIVLVVVLFSFFGFFVTGEVGGNATVITQLQVGNVYPEVLNVSVNEGASTITLIANSTKLVTCVALLRDYNNDTDINHVYSEFFDNVASSYGGADDNNYHYTNDTCFINRSFGSWHGVSDDEYLALANCTYNLEYYSNPQTWNCSVLVNDSINWNATGSDTITVNSLLAVGLPPTINYGTVNATYVSNENVTNVINYGNVRINLSLSGYAGTPGDNRAMNCTVGSIGYIPIYYEKYNMTDSTPGVLGSLSAFENTYINLTSTATVKTFNLNYRHNDVTNEAQNNTYWRIYVPIGVAGTCEGRIVFGATVNPGT